MILGFCGLARGEVGGADELRWLRYLTVVAKRPGREGMLARRHAALVAEAIAAVQAFHEKLYNTHVLDPACGTGNFLYVSLELMKRLEGEVLEALLDLGGQEALRGLGSHSVDPHQFLGLEINPRAAAIAERLSGIRISAATTRPANAVGAPIASVTTSTTWENFFASSTTPTMKMSSSPTRKLPSENTPGSMNGCSCVNMCNGHWSVTAVKLAAASRALTRAIKRLQEI